VERWVVTQWARDRPLMFARSFIRFLTDTKYPQCDVIRSFLIDDPTNTGSQQHRYIVIRFVSKSAKFGIFTVVGLNGTLVEDKIHTFKFVSWIQQVTH
jgi:hypothetical protein